MSFSFILIVMFVVPFAIVALPATTLSLLRGGAIRNPSNSDAADYYEKFHIDYGVDDNRRMAGALRGFIKTGTLANLPQSDAFLRWLQTYMEEGTVSSKGRIKAYHVKINFFSNMCFAIYVSFLYFCLFFLFSGCRFWSQI